ncbi:Cell division protein FtsA [subsurface metagenome]
MIWNPFKMAPKSFLGVDIGTFSIKVVEVSKAGKRRKLENYGEIQASSLYEKAFRTFEKSTLTIANQDVVRAISGVLKEAKTRSKKAYFSIPDFSSFFTTFTLPTMTEEELPQAIEYEARQHIPLPLSEVTLDWQIIEGKTINHKPTPFKILLVAVPNEIIQQYQDIAMNAKLELLSLEAEVFGLARALIKTSEKEQTTALIDIGARSTTISIINKGILNISHSFDTSGNDLTNLIAKGLNVDYTKAEQFKKKHGLLPSEAGTREVMLPLIDLILNEIKKISSNFYITEKKEIEKVIVAGGSALIPGLADYFSKSLNKPVEIANPFSDIYYPPILEDILKKQGPSYAIALGTALRGLE